MYIKTDSYGGLDVRFPMSLKVLKKKEDDIKQQQDAIENVRASPRSDAVAFSLSNVLP